MMSEVDLAREAAHLSRFIYNFRRWKDVSFPRPLYPHVHPAILVETYEHGESVSRYVDDLEGHDRTKLLHQQKFRCQQIYLQPSCWTSVRGIQVYERLSGRCGQHNYRSSEPKRGDQQRGYLGRRGFTV